MIKKILILSICIASTFLFAEAKKSEVFRNMELEPHEEKDIPYINELERYLLAKYGESFCKTIAICFFDDIKPGRRFTISAYDKNNKKTEMVFWVLESNKRYKTYSKLSSDITHNEVLQVMGKTFLNYYFKKHKGIDFDYLGQAVKHSDILNAIKRLKLTPQPRCGRYSQAVNPILRRIIR